MRQRSRQSQFSWHQDHRDLRDAWPFTTSMITVVVCLSGRGSGMQMWGFPVFEYRGAGAAAAFPGAATHRSVGRVPGAVVQVVVARPRQWAAAGWERWWGFGGTRVVLRV